MQPLAAQAVEPEIRVGIWSGQQNLLFSADVDFDIVDTESGTLLQRTAAKEKVSISWKNGKMQLGDKTLDNKDISILLANVPGEHYIEVNKRRYRGEIAIHPTVGKSGMTVVNTLPLEQYLYGIIAKEISPEWHPEAVKAQAVAARSYAMYNMRLMPKHQADGYDVCATTDCQVYGGRESESPKALKAIDDTRGMVLMYQGSIIPAYFHSSGGGYTEDSENVWGSALPYLRGVVDYDQDSPHFKWEKRFTGKQIELALQQLGYRIGTLQQIVVSPQEKAPMREADRGISGRIKSVRFVGSQGSAVVTGNKLRTALNLNSTLFDFSVLVEKPKNLNFPVTDRIGRTGEKRVEVNLPPSEEKAFLDPKGSTHLVTGQENEAIVITGYGWGHGLGLSQWGAKAMAEKAPAGDANYYKTILQHYYQGVTLKKVF